MAEHDTLTDKLERLFGTGPLMLVSGLFIVGLTLFLFPHFKLGYLPSAPLKHWLSFMLALIAIAGVAESVRELPFGLRGERLVTSGMFKYVRHPFYASILLPTPWILVLEFQNELLIISWLITVILSHIIVRREDSLLVEYFGDQYVEYMGSTPALVPWSGRLRFKCLRKLE